jgi:hypothetical protein
MKTTLQSLQESISNAVDMIDQSQLVSNDLLLKQSTKYSTNSLDFTNAKSLLDKCEQVTANYKNTKPLIRIIHHPACSGGSLISKCISAMPNAYLLSEVHPLSDMHISGINGFYAPSDLTTLSRFAGIPDLNGLSGDLFTQNVEVIYQHLKLRGAELVLREHSHFDFFKGGKVTTPAVSNLLKNKFELLQVVTLRNPIDCYLSLLNNNWLTFQPQTFDEYCRRYLKFIQIYSHVEILKYEDFLDNPLIFMTNMCSLLDIRFSDLFIDLLEIFKVTGDSGRSSNAIAKRDRRELPSDFIDEVKSSSYFKSIQAEIDYPGL